MRSILWSLILVSGCAEDLVFSTSQPVLRSGKPTASAGEQSATFGDASEQFGLAGRWITERFRAAQVAQLDLLWVLDGSDSMSEEQGKVAAAAALCGDARCARRRRTSRRHVDGPDRI